MLHHLDEIVLYWCVAGGSIPTPGVLAYALDIERLWRCISAVEGG